MIELKEVTARKLHPGTGNPAHSVRVVYQIPEWLIVEFLVGPEWAQRTMNQTAEMFGLKALPPFTGLEVVWNGTVNVDFLALDWPACQDALEHWTLERKRKRDEEVKTFLF